MSAVDRHTRRVTQMFLLGAVCTAMAFLALGDIAEDQRYPWPDRLVRQQIQSERQPALERPMREFTELGSAYGLIPLNVIVAVGLWCRARRLALLVPAVTLGAPVVEGVSKWVVARARPASEAYGFPSGHVLAAVVFFGALLYVTWATTRRPVWRGLSLVGGIAMVLGIGYTRLYLDAHWFTDVVGGVLAGAAYLLFVILAFERWGRDPRRSSVHRRTRGPREFFPPSAQSRAIAVRPIIGDDQSRGRNDARRVRHSVENPCPA